MTSPPASVRKRARQKAIWVLLAIVALGFFFAATMWPKGKVIPPYAQYEAHLENYAAIDEIERRVKEFGKRRQLEIYEKDREEMAFLTDGNPALFIALYFGDEPVLIVSNVGIGHKVVVTATDYGEMPLSDLERLAQDVLRELAPLGLEFHRVEASREPERQTGIRSNSSDQLHTGAL